MKKLTNNDAKVMLEAMNTMGSVIIPDVNAAFAFVENHAKLVEHEKQITETFKKIVVFTDAEKDFSQNMQKMNEKLTDSNALVIKAEMNELEANNKELANSIRAKNQEFMKKQNELMEQPFKKELKEIPKDVFYKKTKKDDKEITENTLTMAQISGLLPILK